MRLLINLVLLITGIVTLTAGLAMVRENSLTWLVAASGAGLLGLAFYSDRLRVKQRVDRESAERAERINALTSRPWQLHERLEVPQNRRLALFSVSMVLLGGWAAHAGFAAPTVKWPMMLGGLFFFGLGGLTLPVLLAGFGKPALVLDRKGLMTPIDGFIAWQHIDGIYLQVVESRGVRNYTLMFKVPNYATVVVSIHWSQRFMALFGLGGLRRGLVSVPVKAGKERPETIEAVACHLWKAATGHDYSWNPSFSEEANDAFKRLALYKDKFGPEGGIGQQLKTSPEIAVNEMKQFNHDLAVVNGELKKKMRVANWGIGIAIVGLLLSFIWPWIKRW